MLVRVEFLHVSMPGQDGQTTAMRPVPTCHHGMVQRQLGLVNPNTLYLAEAQSFFVRPSCLGLFLCSSSLNLLHGGVTVLLPCRTHAAGSLLYVNFLQCIALLLSE